MKRKIWVEMLLIVTLLFSLLMTACQSEGNTDNVDSGSKEEDHSQNVENDDEASSSAPDVTADWTIEEAIENHMRFACNGSCSLYAVDTKLYGSVNEVFMEGTLRSYAGSVESGEASSTIRQVKIESYQDGAIILDSNGKLWFQGRQILSEYNIAYFSCKSAQSGERIAAVTDEGKVIWTGSYHLWETQKAHEQEGLSGVKYVDVRYDLIAYVREDGTAGYIGEEGECHEIEGWKDIAMVFVCGNDSILGLKKDGTIVAETREGGEANYSQEILSWSDIVYLDWGFDFVAGLKSDGSVVYALDNGKSKTERISVLDNWSNVMVLSAFGNIGAITADNVLLGDAQGLVYAWNFTQPWEGNDAALRDHVEKNHKTYTEKLAEID